jgi:hypothetical protein
MKTSKQIKNALLSIDTILYNAFRISVQTDSPTVTMSKNDAKRILEMVSENLDNLRDIERLSR